MNLSSGKYPKVVLVRGQKIGKYCYRRFIITICANSAVVHKGLTMRDYS